MLHLTFNSVVSLPQDSLQLAQREFQNVAKQENLDFLSLRFVNLEMEKGRLQKVFLEIWLKTSNEPEGYNHKSWFLRGYEAHGTCLTQQVRESEERVERRHTDQFVHFGWRSGLRRIKSALRAEIPKTEYYKSLSFFEKRALLERMKNAITFLEKTLKDKEN